jgi:hypothetical protein
LVKIGREIFAPKILPVMVVIIGIDEVFSLTPALYLGRGRNALSVMAKLKLDSACELSDFTKPTNGGSFSQREKARMRENAAKQPAADFR